MVHDRAEYRLGERSHQKGVAVRRALCDGVGTDGATRAAAVVDDEGLLQGLAQPLGHDAPHEVYGAAGRVGNHHAHRLGGISLRAGFTARQNVQSENR